MNYGNCIGNSSVLIKLIAQMSVGNFKACLAQDFMAKNFRTFYVLTYINFLL